VGYSIKSSARRRRWHLDAVALAIVDRAMNKRAGVKIATEFAVDSDHHIEIESRGNAGVVVVGIR